MTHDRNSLGEKPMPVQQRITVEIEYLDGQKKKIEAVGAMNSQPGSPFLIIPISTTDVTAISVTAIRKWTARASKLSLIGN